MRPTDQQIPEIQNAGSLAAFLAESMRLLKKHFSGDLFRQKRAQLGIQSPDTYQQILEEKKQFPLARVDDLSTAFDFSFADKLAAVALATRNGPTGSSSYVMGSPQVLSSPLHTIVLNACACQRKYQKEGLAEALRALATPNEIVAVIDLLLREELLARDEEGYLSRNLGERQLSNPPGIKFDHAKNYIERSLALAWKNYDLPLHEREYAAFSTKISEKDFPKLKDLVRNFRRAVYELSASEACDAVVQVNVNAFLVKMEEPRA